nr:molybdenum cofactor guanylyltransferase MobA [uncultured Dongia sp.]
MLRSATMTDAALPLDSSTVLTPAVLLAGGRSSRMGGGDKCLRLLGGRAILAHVIGRVRPQVSALVLNANGDAKRFATFGLPVVPDDIGGQPGPLAGILAGLDWAAARQPQSDYVLSVSTDCPFLPLDLVSRLRAATKADTEIVVAASNGRRHPVIGLWRVSLRQALRQALALEHLRKVEAFCDRHRTTVANFPGAVNFPGAAVDPFFNANTPDDLAVAERLWARPDRT